jgi:serine/threonine-protein kinase RsbW
MEKRISFPSKIANVNHVEALINGFFVAKKIDEKMLDSVQLVVGEAIVNAIVHGNRSNPDKTVSLCCQASAEKIVFTINDEGNGFDFLDLKDPTDPENIEKPTGRGIFLMINLADKIEFSNSGSTVKIEFYSFLETV